VKVAWRFPCSCIPVQTCWKLRGQSSLITLLVELHRFHRLHKRVHFFWSPSMELKYQKVIPHRCIQKGFIVNILVSEVGPCEILSSNLALLRWMQSRKRLRFGQKFRVISVAEQVLCPLNGQNMDVWKR